jgi:hypothetical protein
MMVVLVDKLVKTQIVECSAVANWIFSSELGSELTNFYIWEILTSTIEKMNRQVEKYHNELVDLRRQLNISPPIQPVTSVPPTADVDPANEQIIPSTDETKMDENENPTIDEEKSSTNNLKRRRESDDDDDDGEEHESTEKIQSMQISQPPMDEATAKLHEKYEIIEERLSHAREQQK